MNEAVRQLLTFRRLGLMVELEAIERALGEVSTRKSTSKPITMKAIARKVKGAKRAVR